MNNPMQLIQMFMRGGKTPQQIAMNMISQNNPMVSNLIQMAEKGNTKGIESFARNLFKEKGKDFDKEFSDFMQQVNGQNNN